MAYDRTAHWISCQRRIGFWRRAPQWAAPLLVMGNHNNMLEQHSVDARRNGIGEITKEKPKEERAKGGPRLREESAKSTDLASTPQEPRRSNLCFVGAHH